MLLFEARGWPGERGTSASTSLEVLVSEGSATQLRDNTRAKMAMNQSNRVAAAGDLETAAESQARVRTADGLQIELRSQTRVALNGLQPSEHRINLIGGAIRCTIPHRATPQAFQVVTPDITVVDLGTVFTVSLEGPNHTTRVSVEEGEVLILAIDVSLPVPIVHAADLFAVVRTRLERLDLPAPVLAVTLRVLDLSSARSRALDLLAPEPKTARALTPLVEELAADLGTASVGTLALADTWSPGERRYVDSSRPPGASSSYPPLQDRGLGTPSNSAATERDARILQPGSTCPRPRLSGLFVPGAWLDALAGPESRGCTRPPAPVHGSRRFSSDIARLVRHLA